MIDSVLYTGGTFDLFHYGHINFLNKCRNLSSNIIVSLNTDEFIYEFKQKTPVLNYEERKLSVLNSKLVSKVIPNVGGRDSKPAIQSANPNIIAVGDDWAHKDYYKQMDFTQEWLDEQNITLVYIPYTKGISSSEIKQRIL